MMITLIAAAAGMLVASDTEPLVCPVMGTGASNTKGAYSDYNGVRYWYCCEGCQERFEKEPAKYVAFRAKDKTAGAFLFEPITGNRITPEKAIKDTSDYKGVRFYFASAENKSKFDADPAKYGAMPKQDALYCAPGKEVVTSYGMSSGFVDYKGVRYYMCCAGCEKPWNKEPEKNAELSKSYVKAPRVATEKPTEKKG